jgi:hypothetical protein
MNLLTLLILNLLLVGGPILYYHLFLLLSLLSVFQQMQIVHCLINSGTLFLLQVSIEHASQNQMSDFWNQAAKKLNHFKIADAVPLTYMKLTIWVPIYSKNFTI